MFIMVNWALFAALFAGLHYHMLYELAILGLVYALLVAGNWKALLAEWSTGEAQAVTGKETEATP
jgi:hypothetical protein